MGKIIGIDLGTTNSVVAVMEGGQPTVIANQEGARTTPSVVAFTKSGERLVGQVAKRQAITNPENTIFSIKRFMGRRYDEVNEEMKMVPYKVVRGDNGDARVDISGKKYSPPEISAMILAKLKEAAEVVSGREGHAGGDHGSGVLQRRAAPGHQGRRQDRRPGSDAHHQRADGGRAGLRAGQEEERDHRGLRLRRRHVRYLDPRSGRRRGGSEVHQRRYAPGRRQHRPARSSTGSSPSSRRNTASIFRKDQMALQRLKEAAEKAKMELSTLLETEINLPFITADATGPKHLQMKLTRARFEQMVEDILQRSVGPCKQAMADAGVTPAADRRSGAGGRPDAYAAHPGDGARPVRQGAAQGRESRTKWSRWARRCRAACWAAK